MNENNNVYLQWYPFDKNQIASLGTLSQNIVKRYNIHPTNVVGHADIAPTRKPDPGILFPWEELYTQYGVGAWLKEKERNKAVIQEQFTPKEPLQISDPFFLTYLQNYGYDVDPAGSIQLPKNKAAATAFQAHFSRNQQPMYYGSEINQSDLLYIWGLVAKYKLYK